MTIDDIALLMTPGIGIKGAVHLLETFKSAQQIFAATPDELIGKAALRPDIAQQVVKSKAKVFAEAEKELAYCARNDIKAIASTDPGYPRRLLEINDYPHVLFIRGNVDALSGHCLSMVGTRKATPYGEQMCSRLAEQLSTIVPRLCIVSGLAFGIDAAAHRAALAYGVKTAAILANPLPSVTPAQHTGLARDIIEQGGALVSEFHSQTHMNGTGYLARNRIIAGLSAGCIVVESPDGGGSLITAEYARGYNREVMAIPGRVTDSMSSGTNHLIRKNTAHMIFSAKDIIDALGWDFGPAPATFRKPATPQLTEEEQKFMAYFQGSDPLQTETLQQLSGLDPGSLATMLLSLELSGAIHQKSGKGYMKLV